MVVRIATNREPVERALTGAYDGCGVTLRRLTANEFAEARNAATAIVRDSSQLVELLEKHELRPRGKKIRDLLRDAAFMMGVGQWLAAVECGVRAISAWRGFVGEDGVTPIAPDREALEVAFLAEPFLDQVLPMIDAAAQLLVIEGNVSGGSPNGSPAPGRTASPPTTAPTATAAPSRAPRGSRAEGAVRAPRSSSRRSRPKAPPSGG